MLLELYTLLNCTCPYIVSFKGAFYTENTICLALEYMDLGPLSSLLNNSRDGLLGLSELVIAGLAQQILSGLLYLHKTRQVIHRDVKPANILLNSRGQCKLADFGVSGHVGTQTHKGKETFVGTVTYMSPERVQGQNHSFDSDLWSLGLILLEAALGYFPYAEISINSATGEKKTKTRNFWELMDQIVSDPAPALPLEDERFSAEFRQFIGFCLNKTPSKRTSAEELLQHPFLTRFSDSGVHQTALSEWVGMLVAKKNSRSLSVAPFSDILSTSDRLSSSSCQPRSNTPLCSNINLSRSLNFISDPCPVSVNSDPIIMPGLIHRSPCPPRLSDVSDSFMDKERASISITLHSSREISAQGGSLTPQQLVPGAKIDTNSSNPVKSRKKHRLDEEGTSRSTQPRSSTKNLSSTVKSGVIAGGLHGFISRAHKADKSPPICPVPTIPSDHA
jgi:serine/threonine protein kinase